MALLWPDKVFWIGSFCKKKHVIYRKMAQKQRSGGKIGKNLPKKVFFPAPPTSWMSLAETVLAQFELWLKLSWHSFSLAATVAAQFQAETLPTHLSQTHPAGRRSWKKKPFLEGFCPLFVLFFCFFTDYLYMKRIFIKRKWA